MKEGTQSPSLFVKKMEIRSKLMDLAAGSLKKGHFVVDVVASAKNLSKITVIVDGDQGLRLTIAVR